MYSYKTHPVLWAFHSILSPFSHSLQIHQIWQVYISLDGDVPSAKNGSYDTVLQDLWPVVQNMCLSAQVVSSEHIKT